jgi:hypothetical protein
MVWVVEFQLILVSDIGLVWLVKRSLPGVGTKLEMLDTEIPGARMSCKMLRRLSEHHNVECDVQDFLHVSDNL